MSRLFNFARFSWTRGKPPLALTLFFIYLFTLGCAALAPTPHQALAPQDCYTLAWGPEDYKELEALYQKNRQYYTVDYKTFLAAQQGTDLGFSYLRLYKAPEAEAAFQKVLQQYPAFARAQIGLGILQLRFHHNLPLAQKILEEALAPPFEAPPGVSAFGHTYLAIIENIASNTSGPKGSKSNREGPDQSRPERALAHLQEAVRLNPQNLTPYIYWGEILWNRGQYQEAALLYHQAVVRTPSANDPQYENWGWLSLRLGQALYKAGRYPEAREKFQSLTQTINSKKQVPPRLWQAMAQEMYKNLELKSREQKVALLSLSHEPQLDSYCLPSATASIFEYYGESCTQEEVARGANTFVDLDNGGVSKVGTLRKELMDYARQRGFLAYNFCGTLGLLKDMVKNGFPLIASLRYPSGAAHVLVIVGYDDRLGAFIVNDPATVREDYYPYGYFSLLWGAAFNNSLLLVPQDKAKEVEEFLEGMIYCSSKDAVNEGDYYQGRGKQAQAREAYLSALKEDARNIEALYKLALGDIRGKDYLSAQKHLEMAQEVVEKEGRCWEVTWGDCEVTPLRSQLDLAMAFVLGRMDHKEAGAKFFHRALTQNPYNMEVWYQRALAGDREAFTVLMEYQPQKTQNHLLWGKTLAEEGKIKEAKREFRQALRQNPLLTEGYYQLGLMEEKDQNLLSAQDCLTCAQSYAQDKTLKEAAQKKLEAVK